MAPRYLATLAAILTLAGCSDPAQPSTSPPAPTASTSEVVYERMLEMNFDSVTSDLVNGVPVSGTGPASMGATVLLGGPQPEPIRPIQGAGGEGMALNFLHRCRLQATSCPRALIELPDTPLLNPGTRNFRFGAEVLLHDDETTKGSNVMQKGFSTGGGSQWKLQVDGENGRPSCVVAEQEIFTVYGDHTIADGKWHEVACEREGGTFSIFVDGKERSIDIPAGLAVQPPSNMRIGGKNLKTDNDQFYGAIDDVFFDVADR